MDTDEIMRKATEAAMLESEEKLAVLSEGITGKPESVDAKFYDILAKSAKEDKRPQERPVAVYPVPQPLPLSDLHSRLEMCRAAGVEVYEDGPLRIQFLRGAHSARSPEAERTPHVRETW